jgi:5-methylthioadenosine/S-adenosylhomocysteine deaminase
MLEAGVRGIMYQEVFGPDPAQRDASMAELRAKVEALRPRETALVRVGISPHAPYTVSDALFRAATRLALDESLPMAIHIAESEVESQLVEQGAGMFADGLRKRGIEVGPRAASPVALLHDLGVLAATPLLIHCVRLRDEDVLAIARSACGVAHCPTSNAKLGHGIARVRELLDAGVDVGLGSDSVASNNRMDILDEARLAALVQGARLARPDALVAREALHLATLGGARAIGLDDRIGSLEPGKSADLAAFPLDPLRGTPSYDPESAALHALAGIPAIHVAVAGRPLVVDGRPLDSDPSLPARVAAVGAALADWLATRPARPEAPAPSTTR